MTALTFFFWSNKHTGGVTLVALTPRVLVSNIGCVGGRKGRTCSHVVVQACSVAQELTQVKKLGMGRMRLCQGFHPLQQGLTPGIA